LDPNHQERLDEFRSSNACISAIEMDDNIMLPTPSAITKKKDFDDFRSSNACVNTTENNVNIALLRPYSSASQDHGGFGLSDGEAALHHVLFEVLCQLSVGPFSNHWRGVGFREFHAVLLLNQAERDMLTFLDANDVVTPLPDDKKRCSLMSSSSATTMKKMASTSWIEQRYPRQSLISAHPALHVTEQSRR